MLWIKEIGPSVWFKERAMRQPPRGGPDERIQVWQGMAPRLVVVTDGPLHGRQLSLTGGVVTIGQAADNHLRLDDDYVSRHHARVEARLDAVTIEDLGSTNGVLVNGRLINRPVLLQPGDLVQLGHLELRLEPPEAGAAAPPPAPPQPSVHFGIGDQRAGGDIHNVGRDYHDNRRYELGLRLAPMRRRARIVLRLGIALFLAGMAIYGFAVFAAVFNIFGLVGEPLDPSAEPDFGKVFEPVLTWAAPGLVLNFVGIILIVIGLLMRRSVNQKERQL